MIVSLKHGKDVAIGKNNKLFSIIKHIKSNKKK
jgi:hypothetical protein